MTSLYTIGELSDRVGRVLFLSGADRQNNGRITAVPDIRTLRYYTTRGLLSPPEETRGRTAFYGHRHLVQAVAIKRLQAAGESLEAIQQRIIGATDSQLEQWANIAESVWDQLERPVSERPVEMDLSAPAETSSNAPPRTKTLQAVFQASGADRESRSGADSAFWAFDPAASERSPVPGRPAWRWELVPGLRVSWDDAVLAEAAGHDPGWQRAVSQLARQAARIVREAGDELV